MAHARKDSRSLDEFDLIVDKSNENLLDENLDSPTRRKSLQQFPNRYDMHTPLSTKDNPYSDPSRQQPSSINSFEKKTPVGRLEVRVEHDNIKLTPNLKSPPISPTHLRFPAANLKKLHEFQSQIQSQSDEISLNQKIESSQSNEQNQEDLPVFLRLHVPKKKKVVPKETYSFQPDISQSSKSKILKQKESPVPDQTLKPKIERKKTVPVINESNGTDLSASKLQPIKRQNTDVVNRLYRNPKAIVKKSVSEQEEPNSHPKTIIKKTEPNLMEGTRLSDSKFDKKKIIKDRKTQQETSQGTEQTESAPTKPIGSSRDIGKTSQLKQTFSRSTFSQNRKTDVNPKSSIDTNREKTDASFKNSIKKPLSIFSQQSQLSSHSNQKSDPEALSGTPRAVNSRLYLPKKLSLSTQQSSSFPLSSNANPSELEHLEERNQELQELVQNLSSMKLEMRKQINILEEENEALKKNLTTIEDFSDDIEYLLEQVDGPQEVKNKIYRQFLSLKSNSLVLVKSNSEMDANKQLKKAEHDIKKKYDQKLTEELERIEQDKVKKIEEIYNEIHEERNKIKKNEQEMEDKFNEKMQEMQIKLSNAIEEINHQKIEINKLRKSGKSKESETIIKECNNKINELESKIETLKQRESQLEQDANQSEQRLAIINELEIKLSIANRSKNDSLGFIKQLEDKLLASEEQHKTEIEEFEKRLADSLNNSKDWALCQACASLFNQNTKQWAICQTCASLFDVQDFFCDQEDGENGENSNDEAPLVNGTNNYGL